MDDFSREFIINAFATGDWETVRKFIDVEPYNFESITGAFHDMFIKRDVTSFEAIINNMHDAYFHPKGWWRDKVDGDDLLDSIIKTNQVIVKHFLEFYKFDPRLFYEMVITCMVLRRNGKIRDESIKQYLLSLKIHTSKVINECDVVRLINLIKDEKDRDYIRYFCKNGYIRDHRQLSCCSCNIYINCTKIHKLEIAVSEGYDFSMFVPGKNNWYYFSDDHIDLIINNKLDINNKYFDDESRYDMLRYVGLCKCDVKFIRYFIDSCFPVNNDKRQEFLKKCMQDPRDCHRDSITVDKLLIEKNLNPCYLRLYHAIYSPYECRLDHIKYVMSLKHVNQDELNDGLKLLCDIHCHSSLGKKSTSCDYDIECIRYLIQSGARLKFIPRKIFKEHCLEVARILIVHGANLKKSLYETFIKCFGEWRWGKTVRYIINTYENDLPDFNNLISDLLSECSYKGHHLERKKKMINLCIEQSFKQGNPPKRSQFDDNDFSSDFHKTWDKCAENYITTKRAI